MTRSLIPTMVCALLLGVAAIPTHAAGQGTSGSTQRSLTFDSRFFADGYSNTAIATFGVEVMDAVQWPAEAWLPLEGPVGDGFAVWDGQGARNLAHGWLTFALGTFVGSALGHAYHEFGHGTRVAAVGARPWYSHDQADFDAGGAPIKRSGTSDGFFGYFLSSLVDRSGFTYARDDLQRFPIDTESLDAGWSGLIAMSGINNEMTLADALDDHIAERGGHVGLIAPYIGGKLSARSYQIGDDALNDISNVLSFYEQAGFQISHDDIRKGSVIAALGSVNTYRLAASFIGMLGGRSPRFDPWTLGPVAPPSTSFYLNREGLSARVSTAVQVGAVRIPVSAERVYSGSKRTELEAGVAVDRGRTSMASRITLGEGVSGSLEGRYRANERLSVKAGWTLYDADNLRGARHISTLEGGSRHNEFFAALSWTFGSS